MSDRRIGRAGEAPLPSTTPPPLAWVPQNRHHKSVGSASLTKCYLTTASLAAGSYVRPFWPHKNLFLVSVARCLIVSRGQQLQIVPTFMTLVQQNRVASGLRPFGHHKSVGSASLTKSYLTTTLPCRWQLRLALRAERESFSIDSGPLLDSKALCRQLRVVL